MRQVVVLGLLHPVLVVRGLVRGCRRGVEGGGEVKCRREEKGLEGD